MRKLRYRILLLVLFSLVMAGNPVRIEASPVDTLTAKTVAEIFYGSKTQHLRSAAPSATQLVYTATLPANRASGNLNAFYVFNIGSGFVMVAADDRVQPVLAYSLEDSFQAEGMPANIRFFLKEYVDEIAQIVSDPTMAESLVPQWRAALNADAREVRNVAVVGPLLTTRWNQNAYYNNMCPADTGGPNGHTFVGCVATAMGQIMRYWQYPTSGIGSHSYSSDHSGQGYGDYGILSADFANTTYQYNMMPNQLTANTGAAEVHAVAELLFHCGVSVEMMYGPLGSGAYSTDVPSALQTFFGYPYCTRVNRSSYSTDAWNLLIKTELDRLRPVYYNGQGDAGGHAFVCDGYDTDGYYHFNWGWSGNNNGYFLLHNLNPSTYEFNSQQAAIIGVRVPQSVQACQGVDSLTDVDGNVYHTVQVGQQCWMRENMRATRYADGTPIAASSDTSSTIPYRYAPNNDTSLVAKNGYLYNWRAAMGGSAPSTSSPSGVQGVCPTGWHLPSYSELRDLRHFMESQASYHCNDSDTSTAAAMCSTIGWHSSTVSCAPGDNPVANNETGLSFVPAGRFSAGTYSGLSYYSYAWSTTEYSAGKPRIIRLAYNNAQFSTSWYASNRRLGYSVRCLRDLSLSVSTLPVTNVNDTSATCGGMALVYGNDSIVDKGVCWSSQNAFPSLSDYFLSSASGTGSFTSNMVGLQPGTTYCVRAYATDNHGVTAYGPVMTFTTTGQAPFQCGVSTVSDFDGNAYQTIAMGNQCWTRQNIRATHYADGTSIPLSSTNSDVAPCRHIPDNDSTLVEDYGYLYNWPAVMHGDTSSTASPSGVRGICPDGWHVPSAAEWEQLYHTLCGNTAFHCDGGDTAQARAVASTTGWNYSAVPCSPGYAPAENNISGFTIYPAGVYTSNTAYNKGYESSFWAATEFQAGKPYIAVIQNSVVEFSPFYCSNFVSPGRSVRCVRDIAERSLPGVSTAAVTAFTMHTALCGGTVLHNGGDTVTERGICWGTSPMPSIAGPHLALGSDTGTFSITLTDLQPATAYYVRAYATNGVGTAYGNDVAFTTPLCTTFDTVFVYDACESFVWQGETYTSTGDYRFVLSTTEGCDSIVTLQLTIHQPVDTAIYMTTFIPFFWNGIWCDTTGVYTKVLQDMYGCDSTVTLYLSVGLQDLENADGIITLYPNPATDHIFVQTGSEWTGMKKEIRLFDSYGRLVLQREKDDDRIMVSVKDLAPGLYLMKLTVNGRYVGYGKFVKQ